MVFFNNKTLTSIAALILAIVGIIWLIKDIHHNVKVNQIKKWPKVQANVIAAWAVPANSAAGNIPINPSNPQVTNTSAKYKPKVNYVYQVNGRRYSSHNFAYDSDNSYNSYEINQLMDGIEPNSTIRVYYNPSKPSESYIYNGTTSYTGIVISIIMLFLAAYLFCFFGHFCDRFQVKSSTKSPLDKLKKYFNKDKSTGFSTSTPNLTDVEKINTNVSKRLNDYFK